MWNTNLRTILCVYNWSIYLFVTTYTNYQTTNIYLLAFRIEFVEVIESIAKKYCAEGEEEFQNTL